jgi:hypothetical protein
MTLITDNVNEKVLYLTILLIITFSSEVVGQLDVHQTSMQISGITSSAIPSGIWYYVAYTDSTIIHKSIFKYSYTCASFAYQITIKSDKPDSVHFIGYHEQAVLPLIKKDEFTYWAGNEIQHWVLNYNVDFSEFTLKEYMNPTYANKPDPRVYLFTRAKNKVIYNISEHFSSFIFKGKYVNDSLEIVLSDSLLNSDGYNDFYEVIGFENYKSYSIAIDFWEMIPQMDLINFYDEKGNVTSYNWTFEELVLRSVQILFEDGDFVGGKATDVVYRFRRMT